MLMDKENKLADAIDLANIPIVATTLGTAVPTTPTNSFKLWSRNRRMGDNQILAWIHGANAAGGTSLRIIAYVSESATAKTNAVAIADSGVIPTADMTKGYVFPLSVAPGKKLNSSGTASTLYVILEFVHLGLAYSAGKLSCHIGPIRDQQTAQV